MQFENYSVWVHDQIDSNINYIAISLDQGSHFAKYFCNQYSDKCLALYVLIDRIFTKENYEKVFHSENNYNFLKSIIGNDWEKYIIENLTNKTLSSLIKEIKNHPNNEKYIELLNGLCKGIIRSQYDKINKMDVNTVIYSSVETLTPEKLEQNNAFNKRSEDRIIYYYIIDDSVYLIHGKYKDEIYHNIFGLIKS